MFLKLKFSKNVNNKKCAIKLNFYNDFSFKLQFFKHLEHFLSLTVLLQIFKQIKYLQFSFSGCRETSHCDIWSLQRLLRLLMAQSVLSESMGKYNGFELAFEIPLETHD